ncbi:MAG: phenylalanine--tRNA ligase subunit alpha [Nitrososphaerota archaeon]|nr:phenylalanine--tRNA ligase subunit alpha [Nitrososphaerota archaeon]
MSTPMTFHRLEKKVLARLMEAGSASIEELAAASGESPDQVRRAIGWLKDKGLLDVKTRVERVAELGEEGRRAAREGLPERRLLNLVVGEGRLGFSELKARAGMPEVEFNAALGRARRLGWLRIDGEGGVRGSPPAGELPEEGVLRALASGAPVDPQAEQALQGLAKRPGYIVETESKAVSVTLVRRPEGLDLTDGEALVTPELVRKGEPVSFSRLDVLAPAPILKPGRLHPVTNFVAEVREALVSMGFEEVEGPVVQPSFWTFDALFTPQDHPAREMQDTLYVSGVRSRVGREDLVEKVKATHEDGWKTGSRGWRYAWSRKEAERSVLRTHTTAVSSRYLAENPDRESRVFCIGKVFRNENLDATHLFEFTQIEAVISEKDATARRLLGYMTQFYSSLGFPKVRFRPTFFPYTEPSFEPAIYAEQLGRWLEVGGSGVFRPEVVRPLGIRNNVLAWGFGMERIALLKLGEKDLRSLYSNNLSWARERPECQ